MSRPAPTTSYHPQMEGQVREWEGREQGRCCSRGLIHYLSGNHTQTDPPYNWQRNRKQMPGQQGSRAPDQQPPPPTPLLHPAHPPTLGHSPAHLHEVSMVFQYTASRLPGVLVALPWIHSAITREAVLSLPCTPSLPTASFHRSGSLEGLVVLCA